MIIKYTFNNNDYTQIIEKYLKDSGPFYLADTEDFNDIIKIRDLIKKYIRESSEFKKLVKQYDNYKDKYIEEKDITEEEFIKLKNKIINILYNNFEMYIMNITKDNRWCTIGFTAEELQDCKDYIIDNIKISLVDSIIDQSENNEDVYFIVSNQRYITM